MEEQKNHTKTISSKYQDQHGTKNLSCQTYPILYQIFKTIFNMLSKSMRHNPPIKIHTNRIQNRITFKIKTRYSLEPSVPQTMKLLGGSKKKITKDKNGKNVSRLKVTEVVLAHCNLVDNAYQNDSTALHTKV